MEIRARNVTEAIIDFIHPDGERTPTAVEGKTRYYRSFVEVLGPASRYSEEELELLARLTERVDANPIFTGTRSQQGFDYWCDFIEIGNVLDKQGLPFWHAARRSQRGHTKKHTAAEALSRFYVAELIQPGMWVCKANLVHQLVVGGKPYKSIEVKGKKAPIFWTDLLLGAPEKDELEALIAMYVREMALLRERYSDDDLRKPL